MKLSDYVNQEWVGFGAKANKRQIPSICDGLTKTTRKLIWSLKNETKFEIVERLGLKAAERTSYQHGGSSIVDALINMVKGFPGTNNVPMFDGEGQFGHSVDHESSAARYINCRISENFSHWYNKKDFNILEKVTDRGEVLEPVVMAPIAPLVLVNGAFGIGSGYGCNIPQYLPEDVIKSVKEVLEEGFVLNPLTPGWVGWGGTIRQDTTKPSRYFPKGKFKRVDSTTIEVFCLPPSYNETTYVDKVLVPLFESGQIQSFDNESNEIEGWKIIINFKRGILKTLSDSNIDSLLGMENSKAPLNLNLCCWDTKGNIKTYEWVEELIEEWVEWRVGIYKLRLDNELEVVTQNIKFELAKEFTINYFLNSGKAPVKSKFIEDLNSFDNSLQNKHLESLLNIPVMNMTTEGLQKSKKQKDMYIKEKTYLESLTPKSYMLQEVDTLLNFYITG